MARRTVRTTTPAPHAGETAAPAIPESGETPGMGAPPRPDLDEAANPAELDDPMAGSPDRKPGNDNPGQRPLTDNKAGG